MCGANLEPENIVTRNFSDMATLLEYEAIQRDQTLAMESLSTPGAALSPGLDTSNLIGGNEFRVPSVRRREKVNIRRALGSF